MNPLDVLLQALGAMGSGTPASGEAIQRELAANASLNQQGSLMGSTRAQPRDTAQTQGPMLAALSEALNNMNPINWMGGMGGGASLAHVPGTYRAIGLGRAMGDLNPAQYVAQLQTQANYPRFLELIQSMVRKAPGMGESFPVFRGKEINDPLMKALAAGAKDLPVTAVSTNPNIADYFARVGAEVSRKPAMIATGQATPESVVGWLPKRGTMANHEGELILNPNLGPRPQLTAKVDIAKGTPYYTTPRTPQGGGQPIEDIIAAMQQSAGSSPQDEIMRALAQAAQTPY